MPLRYKLAGQALQAACHLLCMEPRAVDNDVGLNTYIMPLCVSEAKTFPSAACLQHTQVLILRTAADVLVQLLPASCQGD